MGQKDVIITRYKILDKIQLTHDTSQFRFAIPDGVDFNFLPGDHIKIYPDSNKPLEFRPYTPTNIPEKKRNFELVIKHYPDGKVSGFMEKQKIGDAVGISGPQPGGHFENGMASKIGMVAGGTGITPFLSMIRSILKRNLPVEISLLYANKTADDIILKDELDKYAADFANFSLFYLLNEAPPDWKMGIRRIDKELMSEKLFKPSEDTFTFVCGPPMMQINLKKQLIELGHPGDRVIFP